MPEENSCPVAWQHFRPTRSKLTTSLADIGAEAPRARGTIHYIPLLLRLKWSFTYTRAFRRDSAGLWVMVRLYVRRCLIISCDNPCWGVSLLIVEAVLLRLERLIFSVVILEVCRWHLPLYKQRYGFFFRPTALSRSLQWRSQHMADYPSLICWCRSYLRGTLKHSAIVTKTNANVVLHFDINNKDGKLRRLMRLPFQTSPSLVKFVLVLHPVPQRRHYL